MKYYTPLRYPGGKGKLSFHLKDIIKLNRFYDKNYIEPFAGGAGVALELLLEEYVRTIHINDIDIAVYSFWYSVLHDTDKLCSMIFDTDINMETWHKQKAILNSKADVSNIELAFATFFLNRTNRSGILNAGVIGGYSQSGKWKLDARFNKKDLLNRIEKIANQKDRIKLTSMDSVELIKSFDEKYCNESFVYLDPPYYVKGQGLYRNFYTHKDHINIRDTLLSSKLKNWVISYDAAQEIKNIYSNFRTINYSLRYSAQNKRNGSEIMIYSPYILIPNMNL
ncbi:DNA adenine methylase [Neisseria sicca]|jgi:DNA-methyltransferase